MVYVFDAPDDDGLLLYFDENEIGLDIINETLPVFGIFITDSDAQELIKLMQNKLNGRWH